MANVTAEELTKFNKLAQEWWDPAGPMKPLHQLNPLRLQFITQHSPLLNKKVLDVGCGAGILSESMAQAGAKVTGLDAAADVLATARAHQEQQKLTNPVNYFLGTLEEFAAQQSALFDVITCMELLEHVPNPAQLIQNCVQLLKPEGFIFFSTINRNLKSFLFAIIGAEYVTRMLPIGTHHYAQFIRPSELNQWAEKSGLQLISLTGMNYQLLKDQFVLTENVAVNYLVCYRKK